MSDQEKLRQVIRDLSGVEATHLRSEPVHETFQGETDWDDVVEVFAIQGDSRTNIAYAWSHETDEGGQRLFAVLGLPPVRRARDAVRVPIVSERRR